MNTARLFALESISQLYLGFFGRAPDAGGLRYWTDELLNKQLSPLVIAEKFAQSDEFIQTYQNLSAREKITVAYNNILERSPDPGGLDYWSQCLESGMPIGEAVWRMVNAAFNQEGSQDASLVQGKVAQALSLISPTLFDIPLSSWSPVSGYGVINVSEALASILGTQIHDGTEFETEMHSWPTSVIGLPQVWSAGFTGDGVVVAVIDTGIDLHNPALIHSIHSASWNFVLDNEYIQDDHGHGTAVASIITSKPSDEQPNALIGGAIDAELLVLKVMDASGRGSIENLIKAIDYAVVQGADVINLSLGTSGFDAQTWDALVRAVDHGVIVTMAAGNTAGSEPQYPAFYSKDMDLGITVGSLYQDLDGLPSWAPSSNQAGTELPFNYINAPGVKVPAYGLNGEILSWSGTSFATPYVTAAIANLLSVNSGLSPEYIVNALVNTSVELVGTYEPLYFA